METSTFTSFSDLLFFIYNMIVLMPRGRPKAGGCRGCVTISPPPWDPVFAFKIDLPHQSVTSFLSCGSPPPKENPGSAQRRRYSRNNCSSKSQFLNLSFILNLANNISHTKINKQWLPIGAKICSDISFQKQTVFRYCPSAYFRAQWRLFCLLCFKLNSQSFENWGISLGYSSDSA